MLNFLDLNKYLNSLIKSCIGYKCRCLRPLQSFQTKLLGHQKDRKRSYIVGENEMHIRRAPLAIWCSVQ